LTQSGHDENATPPKVFADRRVITAEANLESAVFLTLALNDLPDRARRTA
jgi:hypothetical protein